jgi:hypothetical protein
MTSVRLVAFTLGLLAPLGAHAAPPKVQFQPIVKLFAPGGPIPPDMTFFIGGLNDKGDIAFFAGSPTNTKSEVLFQYSDAKLRKIAAADQVVPGGKLPKGLGFDAPISMNQAGSIVFSSLVLAGDLRTRGTFLWDAAAPGSMAAFPRCSW